MLSLVFLLLLPTRLASAAEPTGLMLGTKKMTPKVMNKQFSTVPGDISGWYEWMINTNRTIFIPYLYDKCLDHIKPSFDARGFQQNCEVTTVELTYEGKKYQMTGKVGILYSLAAARDDATVNGYCAEDPKKLFVMKFTVAPQKEVKSYCRFMGKQSGDFIMPGQMLMIDGRDDVLMLHMGEQQAFVKSQLSAIKSSGAAQMHPQLRRLLEYYEQKGKRPNFWSRQHANNPFASRLFHKLEKGKINN
ncbi:MAG: uncharacterized protein KVP18_003236 [Porospora cf. gigantea A]|uniref:uncharacterized protein n=1 Tax=Porospora cf. gigantea A TaxID=2853593 RepID=UPI00355A1846|nr:MAG: hypothetical protein KVP18_003236 [Porospora cf. gigantea A]